MRWPWNRKYRLFITDAPPPGWDGRMLPPGHVDFWCDYGAEVPLWGGGGGMIHADSLPVSDGLRRRLQDFQQQWELLDYDEPTPPELDERGRALLAEVRLELPSPPWRVTSSWYD